VSNSDRDRTGIERRSDVTLINSMLTQGMVPIKASDSIMRLSDGQLVGQEVPLHRPHLAGKYAVAARDDAEATVAQVRNQHAGPAHNPDACRARTWHRAVYISDV